MVWKHENLLAKKNSKTVNQIGEARIEVRLMSLLSSITMTRDPQPELNLFRIDENGLTESMLNTS
jgi:hypothetical protein